MATVIATPLKIGKVKLSLISIGIIYESGEIIPTQIKTINEIFKGEK